MREENAMQFYSRLTTLRQDHPRLVIALGM